MVDQLPPRGSKFVQHLDRLLQKDNLQLLRLGRRCPLQLWRRPVVWSWLHPEHRYDDARDWTQSRSRYRMAIYQLGQPTPPPPTSGPASVQTEYLPSFRTSQTNLTEMATTRTVETTPFQMATAFTYAMV